MGSAQIIITQFKSDYCVIKVMKTKPRVWNSSPILSVLFYNGVYSSTLHNKADAVLSLSFALLTLELVQTNSNTLYRWDSGLKFSYFSFLRIIFGFPEKKFVRPGLHHSNHTKHSKIPKAHLMYVLAQSP